MITQVSQNIFFEAFHIASHININPAFYFLNSNIQRFSCKRFPIFNHFDNYCLYLWRTRVQHNFFCYFIWNNLFSLFTSFTCIFVFLKFEQGDENIMEWLLSLHLSQVNKGLHQNDMLTLFLYNESIYPSQEHPCILLNILIYNFHMDISQEKCINTPEKIATLVLFVKYHKRWNFFDGLLYFKRLKMLSR